MDEIYRSTQTSRVLTIKNERCSISVIQIASRKRGIRRRTNKIEWEGTRTHLIAACEKEDLAFYISALQRAAEVSTQWDSELKGKPFDKDGVLPEPLGVSSI